MRMRQFRQSLMGSATLVTLLITGMMLTQVASASDHPTPPTQLAQGPGGVERPYSGVQSESFGNRPAGYWLFEPLAASGNLPDKHLPLVIFLHGFMAVDPTFYGEWIEHITRGGAIVVFPFYQTINPLTLRPNEYLDNTNTAIADALVELAGPGHAQVDLTRVAVVGHSAGGVLAVNYAATAEQNGLPVPSVIMPVEPGGCKGCTSGLSSRFGISLEDLSTIAPATRVIVIAGDADHIVGTEPAKHIWESLTSLLPGNRDYVLIRSDNHGKPVLRANHLLPIDVIVGTSDALDWYGPWKLFDGLIGCAFDSLSCDRALGGTPFQEDMGAWSDGTPVKPAVIESA